MTEGWRSRLTIIAYSVALTSLVWIAGGTFWWIDRFGSPFRATLEAGTASRVPLPFAERARADRRDRAIAPSRQSRTGDELLIPVAGAKPRELIDTFTQAREGGQRTHDAIDIMAPIGTPVVAASAGVVEKLFLSKAGGKTIYTRSPDGTRIYYYAHLESYAPNLREGLEVQQGQQIGAVGHSGNADPQSPHLHFAIMATTPDRKWYEQASALNPYPLLIRSGERPAIAGKR